MGGALDGLRVIDAGNMIAGPMAATLLADHGADVVKIEHPSLHDPLRDWEPKKDGCSLWWKAMNRNKRFITLDLSKPDGQAIFERLVHRADVIIENFRPGTFERWGCGPDVIEMWNPRAVLVRVSGFGQTGPMAAQPGYGTIAEAMSGIPSFTGFPDGPPVLPAFPMADAVTSSFAALAAMMALNERARSGRGQVADIALYESLFRLVDAQVIGFDQLGIVKDRRGNRLAEDAPRNAYETADGQWLALSASSNRTFERLALAIGQPELASDPLFASSSQRVAHVEALDAILSDWFGQRDAAAALSLLEEHDVVVGPVLDISEIFEHPQYKARGNIVRVEDERFGSLAMQGPVPSFSRSTAELHTTGGEPGQDNGSVYGAELGLSEDELAAFAAKGVI